jgi:hypothetical protein
MHYRVLDVSFPITQRMMMIDDYYARCVILDATPALAHHFSAFISKLDGANTNIDDEHVHESISANASGRAMKSEIELGDDLISFYDFGILRHEARGLQASRDNRGARVLLGTRTSDLDKASESCITPADAVRYHDVLVSTIR